MTNDRANSSERRDSVAPDALKWNLGFGSEHHREILWRCDALRAGRLYQRTLFGTQEEAEQFVQRMREAEPDQMFNVQAIKASSTWN